MAELYSWVVSCANRVDVYLQNGQVVTDGYKLRVPGTNSLFQVQIKGGGGDLFLCNKNLQPYHTDYKSSRTWWTCGRGARLVWTGNEEGLDGGRGA